MTTYTLNYYEGEERDVKLNSMFTKIESFVEFIESSGLHPDYILVTEWDGQDIVQQIGALHYFYNL